MQPATGPLTTGTYVIHFHATKHIPAVRSDGTNNSLTPIKDTTKEDVEVGTTQKDDSFAEVKHQWNYESLGNDRYRVSHKASGASYQPDEHAHGAAIRQESEPNEWIVKESETKGIYQ